MGSFCMDHTLDLKHTGKNDTFTRFLRAAPGSVRLLLDSWSGQTLTVMLALYTLKKMSFPPGRDFVVWQLYQQEEMKKMTLDQYDPQQLFLLEEGEAAKGSGAQWSYLLVLKQWPGLCLW